MGIFNNLHPLLADYHSLDKFDLVIIQIHEIILPVDIEHTLEVIEDIMEQWYIIFKQLKIVDFFGVFLSVWS